MVSGFLSSAFDKFEARPRPTADNPTINRTKFIGKQRFVIVIAVFRLHGESLETGVEKQKSEADSYPSDGFKYQRVYGPVRRSRFL